MENINREAIRKMEIVRFLSSSAMPWEARLLEEFHYQAEQMRDKLTKNMPKESNNPYGTQPRGRNKLYGTN